MPTAGISGANATLCSLVSVFNIGRICSARILPSSKTLNASSGTESPSDAIRGETGWNPDSVRTPAGSKPRPSVVRGRVKESYEDLKPIARER
jgi:hypothetical protein